MKEYLCIALYENSHRATFEELEALLHKNNYILTLDFVLKMLKIHERRKCRIPVVIEGETGVGKTALIEMLSQFWNLSWIQGLRKYQEEIGNAIEKCKCSSFVHRLRVVPITETLHIELVGRAMSWCVYNIKYHWLVSMCTHIGSVF